jgi:adenylyl cyclase-associated protein
VNVAEKKMDKPVGEPKIALEGNKWVIENHFDNSSIILDSVELKQTVYIFNCVNSCIQIKDKVNAVTIDKCQKSGIVLSSVVSTLDVINSKRLQVQVLGKTPTISIDKTDGVQLFLSKECLDVQLFTSKTSEINMMIPNNSEDFTEVPIAEQFKTVSKPDGKLLTVPVEHNL